jgi:hypothetical protein
LINIQAATHDFDMCSRVIDDIVSASSVSVSRVKKSSVAMSDNISGLVRDDQGIHFVNR